MVAKDQPKPLKLIQSTFKLGISRTSGQISSLTTKGAMNFSSTNENIGCTNVGKAQVSKSEC